MKYKANCKVLIFLVLVTGNFAQPRVQFVSGDIQGEQCKPTAETSKIKAGDLLSESCILSSKSHGYTQIQINRQELTLTFPGSYRLKELNHFQLLHNEASIYLTEAIKSGTTIIILSSSGGVRSRENNQPASLSGDTAKNLTSSKEENQSLLRDGNYQKLIQKIKPESAQDHYILGQAHFHAGSTEQAKAHFQKSTQYSADLQVRNHSLMFLSQILINEGRYQEAARQMRRFKNSHVKSEISAELYFLEGLSYLALQDQRGFQAASHNLNTYYANHPLNVLMQEKKF